MKNNFIITLNSRDTSSWYGSNIYDCNYFINLNNILSTIENEKTYKISFSFKSNKSVFLIGKVVGLYLNNITYSIKNQQNFNQTFLLGLLKTTSFKNYIVDATTKEDTNQEVILQGLNNTTTLSLNIKTLLSSSLYDDSLTGLGNLINWYKFLLVDLITAIPNSLVYNYKTTAYDGVLFNGATITQSEILDLTEPTSYLQFPTFNWSIYETDPISFSCWFSTTNQNAFSLFAINNTRITLSGNNWVGYFNSTATVSYNGTPDGIKFTNGKWFHVVWIFGKIDIHKLYINGVFVDAGVNLDFGITATEVLTFLGKNRTWLIERLKVGERPDPSCVNARQGARPHAPHTLDRQRRERANRLRRLDDRQAIGLPQIAGDLGHELRRRHAHADRQTKLGPGPRTHEFRHPGTAAMQALRSRGIDKGLVDRQRFDLGPDATEDRHEGGADLAVPRAAWRRDDCIGAEPQRLRHRHCTPAAVAPGFVAGGRHDRSRPTTAHEHRPASPLGMIKLLDAREERVEIGVEDHARPCCVAPVRIRTCVIADWRHGSLHRRVAERAPVVGVAMLHHHVQRNHRELTQQD